VKPTNLREGAEHVAQRLRDAGFEAYFAGGCVRDLLRGSPPKDYDVVTNARPEQVESLFKRTLMIGAAFGVIKVLLAGGYEYEVATYRTDGVYGDGRRPDEVKYSTSVEEDVKRRDFTINALLEDPFTGEILDYVGGREDLEKGIVRAVGDATKRVAEDRLRMLRAIRFAARFGFAIETGTMDAIKAHAAEIVDVSAERITAELEGMWSTANPLFAFALLEESGLLPHVLPFSIHRTLGIDILPSLARDAETTRYLAWSLLFLDMSDKEIEDAIRKLKLSRDHLRTIRMLVHAAPILRAGSTVDRLRLAVSEHAPLYKDFAKCLGVPLRWTEIESELAQNPLPPMPLVTGADLKDLGIPPGPKYKEILDAVELATLERRIQTKEEALALVRDHIA
jgi:poly(A) polymerase